MRNTADHVRSGPRAFGSAESTYANCGMFMSFVLADELCGILSYKIKCHDEKKDEQQHERCGIGT